MGARTQIGGLLAAATVVLVLLFLTGPIADLPKAVLGAVIVSAAVGLVEPAAWRGLWDTDRVEFTIAAVTTAGVVAVGVLERFSSPPGYRSSTSSGGARGPMTPCSGGSSGSGAGATSPSIAPRGHPWRRRLTPKASRTWTALGSTLSMTSATSWRAMASRCEWPV
jgi:hypothetical protein